MIGAVLRKELTDHLRDGRSVLGAMILPVLGPLLVLMLFVLVARLEEARPLVVAAVGQDRAPLLVKFLEQNGAIVRPPPDDLESAVMSGDVDAVLNIGEDYGARMAQGRSAPVTVLVDHSNHPASKNVRRLEQLLAGYARQLAAQRLVARGVVPELADPLQLEEVNVASPERMASSLLNVIPLFLMLAALVGGMNVAIDTTAGERERGSLEPLLLTPVSRGALVLGKWLATSTAAIVVSLTTMLVFALTVGFMPLEQIGLRVGWGVREGCIVLLVVLPLTFFGAALQMLVATFARSFKEAQTYLNLLNLVPMVPSLLLMFSPAERSLWMTLVPTVAQVTTIVDALRAESVSAAAVGLIWLSTAALTAPCLWTLARILERERIIFGR